MDAVERVQLSVSVGGSICAWESLYVCELVCVYCQSIWQMPEPRKFLNAQRGPSRIVVVAIAAAAVV